MALRARSRDQAIDEQDNVVAVERAAVVHVGTGAAGGVGVVAQETIRECADVRSEERRVGKECRL